VILNVAVMLKWDEAALDLLFHQTASPSVTRSSCANGCILLTQSCDQKIRRPRAVFS